MVSLSSISKAADITAPAIPPGPVTNGHGTPLFPEGEEPSPSIYLKYLPAVYSADEFVGRFLRIFQDVLMPIEEMVDNQAYYFDPMTTPTDFTAIMRGILALTAGGQGASAGRGGAGAGSSRDGRDGAGDGSLSSRALPASRSGSGGGVSSGASSGTGTGDGRYATGAVRGGNGLARPTDGIARGGDGALASPAAQRAAYEATPELLDYIAQWVDMDDEGEDWPLERRRKLISAAPVLYRMRGTTAGISLHLGIYTGGLVLVEERTNGFRLASASRLGINTSIGEDRPRLFTITVAVPDPETLDMDAFRAIIEADKPVDTTYILRVVKMNLRLPKLQTPRW